ncbi:endonuclease/exonuclease/phosphatase family protein [Desmospora activa]|nr:endonuclease/exonuclease/phosphatase family protein [Desmospora activa]
MSYNIRHGLGCDGRLDINRIAEVIQLQQADVVGLNEVDVRFHRRTAFADQLDILTTRLNMDGAFAPAIKVGNEASNDGYGNALLLRKGGLIDYTSEIFTGKGEECRSLLLANVEIDGCHWRIAVTHIGFSPWMRRRQVERLEQLALERTPPLVVMGDFNMSPGHIALAPLECRMIDVLAQVEEGTYPCYRPRRRIDGIYCTPGVKVITGWVVDTPDCPSDHRPVMGELQSSL